MEQAVVDILNLKKEKKSLCIENKKSWKEKSWCKDIIICWEALLENVDQVDFLFCSGLIYILLKLFMRNSEYSLIFF